MISFGWMPRPHCLHQKCCEAAPSRRQRSAHLEARHWLHYPTLRIGSLASKQAVVVAEVHSWWHVHVLQDWIHYQWHMNHLAVGALGICATGVHLIGKHCNASLDQIYPWGSSFGNHPLDWDHPYPLQKPVVAGKRHMLAYHLFHLYQTFGTFWETCWKYDAISFWRRHIPDRLHWDPCWNLQALNHHHRNWCPC